MNQPSKRSREEEIQTTSTELKSLSRSISPPRKKRVAVKRIRSPWQLTRIRDLPEALNQDTVTLNDLLGDPLISDCWEFNYLHDIPFLLKAFDRDTRHLVHVHVVHGFWKRDDPRRQSLVQQAAVSSNVTLHDAFMPEMFGTHHSKMMILFRHDDTAQVIIHTANMIAKDWTNMTNAVWKSPMLPKEHDTNKSQVTTIEGHPIGTGERFKTDLLAYLRAYDRRNPTMKPLVDRLKGFDFSAVKAALVASVPGRHHSLDLSATPWGHSAMRQYLKRVPCKPGPSEIVAQVSSIATLGATDEWLQNTLFQSMSRTEGALLLPKPKFKVVFPTADEIRLSLDGYESGASIHTKTQSQQQSKQLQYLRPIFHHWDNDCAKGKDVPGDVEHHDSGRNRAAPHVKTYIRTNCDGTIDWALLTSANLSKQAWGEATRPGGEVRVASWEIGVLLWPELLEKDSVMVGVFKTDTPEDTTQDKYGNEGKSVVGVRMPYSTPLQRYGKEEVPWVATMSHREPDWRGGSWVV